MEKFEIKKLFINSIKNVKKTDTDFQTIGGKYTVYFSLDIHLQRDRTELETCGKAWLASQR